MIETWSRGNADGNMPEEILAETGSIIARHPWWRARADVVIRLLSAMHAAPPSRPLSILDVGCGWGVTLHHLEAAGLAVAGLDISRQALELLEAPGRRLIEADLTQDLPAGEMFDAVLALDVIEHLDDDCEAVRRLSGLIAPGGRLVVSVPALPFLFSEFDAVQGHRRRYTPSRLRTVFVQELYEIESLFWWGAWMVPLLGLRQLLAPRGGTPVEVYRRYLRLPGAVGLSALRLAFLLEGPLALRGWLPIGTSLVAVARRR